MLKQKDDCATTELQCHLETHELAPAHSDLHAGTTTGSQSKRGMASKVAPSVEPSKSDRQSSAPTGEYIDRAYSLQRVAVRHALLVLSTAYLALLVKDAVSSTDIAESAKSAILMIRALSALAPFLIYGLVWQDALRTRVAIVTILSLLVLLVVGSHVVMRLRSGSSDDGVRRNLAKSGVM